MCDGKRFSIIKDDNRVGPLCPALALGTESGRTDGGVVAGAARMKRRSERLPAASLFSIGIVPCSLTG